MPCPDDLTPRQCKLRDALAKKLKGKEGVRNPWALATAKIHQKREAKRGQQ